MAVGVPQRVGDQGLDLVGSLGAGEHELPRGVRDTDLDLHADLRALNREKTFTPRLVECGARGAQGRVHLPRN
ncbi:hypothetical protein Aglo01_54180 [Actinokineospora globicatena]|uniref:Uncharacterized protein n=1 Tax=Actinokineospora globicatena TaxID=103729 RepID=A0A9W6VA48_9PSEU|nr:hypothetical protein Aglo01_54180 [Actinokineospora globicatena]GLW88130.1 hypothetical protein Aglo02_57690 [Actinokineospora globicatena]GLW92614.1 hypothetical protein Aglo03_34300 [Actinokineospora globicatena]